ncbi:MAG: ACP S-malonyltransferase [Blastocatellia bacterium]|nr:ACP S-malonyltransferase [Blastocatellia bacterium]
MGKQLFELFPEITSKADAILGYSIRELCVEDPYNKLSQTDYTQPAIFVVSVLSYLKHLSEGASLPDYFAGHSLGEYTALFAAGVFDFETGLKLVQKRGALMNAASGGGMAAIIQLERAGIDSVIEKHQLKSIDIANFNAPKQTVIAGPLDELNRAKKYFEDAGATFIQLNVSAPFHSRYMEPARVEFAKFIEKFDFNSPKVPVISNVYASPYLASASDIKATLAKQITSPVRWVETIWYLMRVGVSDSFKELGPGEVLTKLVKTIAREGIPANFSIDIEEAVKPIQGADTRNVTKPTVPNLPITAETLGSTAFKRAYGVKLAYIAGSMYMGIASKEMVVRMGRAGYLGFFGTGGLSLSKVEASIEYIKRELSNGQAFGMNLLFEPEDPEFELETVALFQKHNITAVEASAFMQITPALVLYRLKGLSLLPSGEIAEKHKIIAKVSRPEVAKAFLEPSPAKIVEQLLQQRQITPLQAQLGQKLPVATDLCIEADSGGHTDMAVMATLLPTIVRLRDRICAEQKYEKLVRVGAAGGIGTPEAAAAAFLLGADFILTGSINQCTQEAGTSDLVKDMLQKINVQDTDYAPAGDMFEIGAKVQVMKRGVFFPARANKLYELWKNYESIDEINEKDRNLIQEKYFKRSFEQVYADVEKYYHSKAPEELAKAKDNPKHKMALIFKTYFATGTRAAIEGDENNRVNFQVQCGPALGAFNQWVAGTELEDWRNRHVDQIAEKIMHGAAALLNERFAQFVKSAEKKETMRASASSSEMR